jgi:hypothetical protein
MDSAILGGVGVIVRTVEIVIISASPFAGKAAEEPGGRNFWVCLGRQRVEGTYCEA